MKKILFAALFSGLFGGLFSGQIAAQEAMREDTVHYLLKARNVKKAGIFVTSEGQYGQSAGEMTWFGGGSAMLLLNKRLGIGVAGFELADRQFSPATAPGLAVRAGFGGLNLSYTFRPDAAVHFGLSLLSGMGMAATDSLVYLTDLDDDFDHSHGFHNGNRRSRGEEFFVMQPGLFLEANLVRGVKIFTSANYRFSSKTNSVDNLVPTDALNGFSVGAGLKIGFFDIRKPKKISRPNWFKKKGN